MIGDGVRGIALLGYSGLLHFTDCTNLTMASYDVLICCEYYMIKAIFCSISIFLNSAAAFNSMMHLQLIIYLIVLQWWPDKERNSSGSGPDIQ